uniref:Centromere/kinetochore protein zw10 homolog n=2 Tax=Ascaris TaxID=6251 RepID=A0A0M3IFF2_ASCLU
MHSRFHMTLKRFFGYLEQDLGGVIVSDKNDMRLAQMIGKKTGDQLVDMIVKECLTPAVPYSAEEKPYFEELLTTADNFHEYLTSLGFFTNETITFKKFTDNHNTVFINRRCTTFVTKARALIDSPLMPLVTVGSGERERCEATEAFKKANSFVGKGVVSEHCPSLMQFMRCKVSDSCVKLFELVEECLKEAAESESEVAAGRLFQTALNMMQLFVLTAPRQHEAQLSSIPLMTGKPSLLLCCYSFFEIVGSSLTVFYNNCHYLCHCLMTASVELHAQVMRAMKGASCGISLIESIPRLRKVAAQLMEGQLMQCRRQISTILVDEQMFVGLHESERLTTCEKTLEGCMMHLQQIATVWKEVLTDTVYGNSMGDLSSFLLSTVNQFVLKTVDIRAADAQIMAMKIQNILQRLEKLFIFGNDKHSSIHRFAETAYYRTKEIVFCLEGSLEDVFDRWCSGKGPMAQWLSANEVRGLIKALFQNTTKRAHVLASVK